MHKRLVNHCTIELLIRPAGPILIKAGDTGADPTKPDMEFVETYHQGGKTIYLPGSSLKGAIRAHAERIVRTIGKDTRDDSKLWASNPLDLKSLKYLDNIKDTAEIYQKSSFTCQMFGNTSLAARLRIEDAYPIAEEPLKIEERNGVAIDRIYGSTVSGALFNYQVCTAGAFKTRIHLKNFTLAQLGLLGLVLRDLNDGWFGLGFAKSRGMGTVEIEYRSATVQYPGCVLEEDKIKLLGSDKSWEANELLGAGMFLVEDERKKYGFPDQDKDLVAVSTQPMALDLGVELTWQGAQVSNLFLRSVAAWKRVLTSGAQR